MNVLKRFLDKATVTSPKRFWLVGASQGIGKALAEQLLTDGHFLVLSSRSATTDLADLQMQYPEQVTLLNIDVADIDSSLDGVCRQAWEAYQGLDYWFYNVAMYEKTNIADSHSDVYAQMMIINYQGFVRLVHQLLPYFSKQGHGRWLVNGSISAHFGLPAGMGYSASKAALLNVCQGLQPELKTTGIDLQIINHGFVKTRLTAKNDFSMPFLLTPAVAANRIKQFMLSPVGRFELKFPLPMVIVFALLKLLPTRMALALTKKLLPAENDLNTLKDTRVDT